jgi:hypothetical protein
MSINGSVYCILFLFALFLLPASSTTVLVYRSPTSIVIAADTLFVLSNGHGWDRLPTCKIRKSGNVYFSAAGITQSAVADFDAFRLAEKSAQKARSAVDAAKKLQRNVVRPFKGAVKSLSRKDPEFCRIYIKERPEPLQVIFVAVDKGIPTFALVVITTSESNGRIGIATRLKVCPGTECPTGYALTILGINSEAEKVTKATPNFSERVESSPVLQLRALIELEAKTHSDFVSTPYDILTIDASGHTWNEHGPCEGE